MEIDFQLIDKLLETRDIKKAERIIARHLRSTQNESDLGELLFRRAKARLIAQNPEDALQDAQAAQELLAENSQITNLLADAYFSRFELSPVGFAERTDANEAQRLYQQIVDSAPDYGNMGWVLYQQGRILLTENKMDEAIDCFQAALLKPSQMPALTALCYERLGFIYLFDRRDSAMALSFLERAAVTYPPTEPGAWLGQLHILRSRALRENGAYNEALEAAELALRTMLAPGNELREGQRDAHFALGEILADLDGQEERAIQHLHQFIQLGKKPLGVDVTWSRAYELLGDLHTRLEQYEAAIEAYNYALTFNPYHPWEESLYYRIAQAYYQSRAYDKVIAAIGQMQSTLAEQASSVSDYRVFHILGNAFFAVEQYEDALVAYQQALAMAPSQPVDTIEQIQHYLQIAQKYTHSD